MSQEIGPLLLASLIALLALLGGSLVLLGLTARSERHRAVRYLAWAWGGAFIAGALFLASGGRLQPATAALAGTLPVLLLAWSLAVTGRRVGRWLLVALPAAALLRVFVLWLGPQAIPVWGVAALTLEGAAAIVLWRGARPDSALAERLLPYATALVALAHGGGVTLFAGSATAYVLLYLGLFVIGCVLPLQTLVVVERMRGGAAEVERRRRESERRFEALAEFSNLVVLILDTDNRVVEWNHAAEAIYGWTREEALGREYLTTFLSAEMREPIAEEIRRVLDGNQAHGYENPVCTRDGERILRWNVTRLLDDDGRPSGILCLAEDVTEQRRRSAERERLYAAVEQAGDGVVIADRRGVVVYANPAFSAMMEKEPREVLGHSIREVVHGWEDQEIVREVLAQWQRGEPWKGRYRTRWPDGRIFVRDATFAPMRDENGGIAYGVAVLHDVTREQELEAELVRSQKLNALGTLAGGIAHDFNNLLTAVIGGAHLLLEAQQSPAETKATAEEILEAAQRGASLSRQLLAFSRRQPLRAEVIDLGEMVRDMQGLLERLIGEHIELVTHTEDGLWPVTGERSQIEQVIMNLVLNARDAMPGGGRLTLTVSGRSFEAEDEDRPRELAPGSYVSLRVVDTGIGMDETTRLRAFEPFFTSKPLGSGTGLGLATVFGIVRQCGGDVSLRSTPGEGSRVDVYLPRAEGSTARESARKPASDLRGEASILLVEDDALVRRSAARTLQELGYQVTACANGEQAIRRLGELSRVDLLVTDVVMPGHSGPELAAELRRRCPGLGVLFVSGYEGQEQVLSPADPLLEKPFTPVQLAEEVRDALARRSSPAPDGAAS